MRTLRSNVQNTREPGENSRGERGACRLGRGGGDGGGGGEIRAGLVAFAILVPQHARWRVERLGEQGVLCGAKQHLTEAEVVAGLHLLVDLRAELLACLGVG